MATEHLSWGQKLALDQLSDIADVSDGVIEIVEVELPSSDGGSLLMRLSVDTSDYKFQDGGFKFRKREPLCIYVPHRFPIQPPFARFAHTRFMGRGHVQWGNHLCLYQATDVEWAASDGMFGFIMRLDEWLRDAALDQLDPHDAPLHPPTEYPSSDIKFAVEIDTPELEEGAPFWIGAAKLSVRNKHCFNISGWTDILEELPEKEKFAAVVLLNQAMPTEYPDTISKLIVALRERGVPFSLLFSILKIAALCQDEGEPLYFILGAPMRRRSAGEPVRQHLTAWKMDGEHVKALRTIVLADEGAATEEAWKLILEWATEARTEWCRVYDSRPEVTFRRDQDTNASWFLEKSVAVLGCGAFGSHIGEYLVRAGVAKIRLVDISTINPGILVRQQFKYYQVGYTKQSGLAVELGRINPKTDIDHHYANLTKGWPDGLALEDFDLVVDATASRRVAAALQQDWIGLERTPPILRCSVSGNAAQGIASLKMPKSMFGMSDIIRQTKLAAFNTPELSEFAQSFWPDEQKEAGFQPEPGCSEPTFVGSAADIAFFASSFFNFVARSLNRESDDAAKSFFVSAANDERSMNSQIVNLGEADLSEDTNHGYRIHLSQACRKAVESEIRSSARTGSPKDETGGLLLGEIDDSLRTISIDVATGPPPDSVKSPDRFLCGIEGTEELCRHHATRSGNSTQFVGVWHTHPISMPDPSSVDIRAMAEILHFQDKTPRHVVMLIVGHASTRPVWRFHLFRKDQFQITSADSEVVSDDE